MPIGRYKVAILADIATVKPLRALLILAALCAFAPCDFAAARVVPLRRPRPAEIPPVPFTQEGTPEEPPAPSACRLRLTAELAIAPSLPALVGPGECAVDDVVRLEAVRLADKTQVAVTPPAILRCSFAEAIVHWVRQDVVPAVRSLGERSEASTTLPLMIAAAATGSSERGSPSTARPTRSTSARSSSPTAQLSS